MKIGTATALALGLSFSPSLAADPVVIDTCNRSGVIGAFGELGSTYDYFETDVRGLGGYGKINFCDVLGTGLDVQTGVYAEILKSDSDFGPGTPEAGNLGYVSHYYYRNEDLALGVLSGLGLTFDDIFRGNQSEITSVIGLDAHAYVDRLTIAGQFAYWTTLSDNDDNSQLKDAYQVSGELRYFPMDNLKLVGHVAYDWASNEFDRFPWKAVSFGAGAEYQFDAYPVSVFADYTRTEGKMGSDSIGFSNLDSDQFRAGLAIHFNSDSLFTEDRKGPSFKSPVVDPLQNFLATSWQQI
jgi:hypothetical protein